MESKNELKFEIDMLGKLTVFPLVVNDCEYNDVLVHFFPTMQSDVLKILRLAENDVSGIKTITVFGSSLTYDCGIGSDIDLLIEIDGDEDDFYRVAKTISTTVDNETDILWERNLSDNSLIRDEIRRKGYCIYG